jgi:glycosyltransferase involved in cell wall biosynthesis
MPQVSVIIPLYNAASFIVETLHSVIASQGVSLEIIVVDDGSLDDGPDRVQKLKHPLVTLLQNKGNKGASAARNVGIAHATGQFILFLDGDDLIAPDKIQKQLQRLVNTSNAICFGDTRYFFHDEEDPYTRKSEPNQQFYFDSNQPIDFILNLYGLNGNAGMIPIHAWLCPVDSIRNAGPWNESLSVDDDGEYFCRVMLQTHSILYAPEAIGYYRKFRHRKSLSKDKNRKGMESLIRAAELKHMHIAQVDNHHQYQLAKVFNKVYMEAAMNTWPVFPDLTRKCIRNAKATGCNDHTPLLGNPWLEKLKPWFGWQLLSYLAYYKNHLFSKK